MKTTTNYGLKKPDGTDLVNIEDLNYNADKIDATLKTAGDNLTSHNTNASAHATLFAGKAAASHKHSAADITSGTLPISRGGTGATTAAAIRTNLGACQKYRYTVTIPTGSWTTATKGWYKTVSVSGITSAMTPTVDVVQSSTASTAMQQLEAWGCISRIETQSGAIKVYCYEKQPSVSIPIQLTGVI